MDNYTIFYMFENPGRGRQSRNFTTNLSKILDLKSSSEQISPENWRWVPLKTQWTQGESFLFCQKNGIQDVCIVYFHTFSRDLQIQSLTKSHRVMFACGRPRIWLVGLSQLCPATLEQLFAFGHTGTSLCGSGNLEQLLLFWAFFGQNVGLK